MDFVTSNIAIGNCDDPHNCQDQYDAILNVAGDVVLYKGKLGLRIPVTDSGPIKTAHLDRAFKFLDEQTRLNKRVLVHCGAGVSRSVAIVCGYIAFKTEKDIAIVLDEIKKIRKQARPHALTFASVKEYVAQRRTMPPDLR